MSMRPFFLLLAAALPSSSQTPPDTFGRTRLSLFAGGSLRPPQAAFTVAGRPLQGQLDRSPSFGLRLTRDLAGPVALDLSYRFSPSHLSSNAARLSLDLHQVSLGGLVYLCGARCELRPFLSAGADFNGYFLAPHSAAYRPGFHFGAGLEATLHRRFALRFDFRNHTVRFPSAPRVHDLQFSAAAVFRFR